MTYPADDIAPDGYKPYPGGTPEFRTYIDSNNNSIMQVRYVHKKRGYTGLWMNIETVKIDDNSNNSNTSFCI